MHRPTVRHLLIDADAILARLSERQFLRPHQPIGETLELIRQELGVCGEAVSLAVDWLGVNLSQRIGRYRRSELSQLAKSIHRFWRHTATPMLESIDPTTH